MENKILVKKKYLVFRQEVTKLIQPIRRRKLKRVLIDFSQVIFLSRSFVDEFLNHLEKLEQEGIKVKFLNLKPALQKFITRVKKSKHKIKKMLAFIE